MTVSPTARLGSMSGGNDQLTPHFSNGSRGPGGSTPYSEWVITAVSRHPARSTFWLHFAAGRTLKWHRQSLSRHCAGEEAV